MWLWGPVHSVTDYRQEQPKEEVGDGLQFKTLNYGPYGKQASSNGTVNEKKKREGNL
jgi:hypothetical protein